MTHVRVGLFDYSKPVVDYRRPTSDLFPSLAYFPLAAFLPSLNHRPILLPVRLPASADYFLLFKVFCGPVAFFRFLISTRVKKWCQHMPPSFGANIFCSEILSSSVSPSRAGRDQWIYPSS